jgi:hypothetical protein
MEYREIAPRLSLTPFVVAFWTLRGVSTDASVDLVLPDGHAELVIHRAGRFRQWQSSGEATERPAALVAPVMDRAVPLAPAASFETVGVRFAPHGLARCAVTRNRAQRPPDAGGRCAVTGGFTSGGRRGTGRLTRGGTADPRARADQRVRAVGAGDGSRGGAAIGRVEPFRWIGSCASAAAAAGSWSGSFRPVWASRQSAMRASCAFSELSARWCRHRLGAQGVRQPETG